MVHIHTRPGQEHYFYFCFTFLTNPIKLVYKPHKHNITHFHHVQITLSPISFRWRKTLLVKCTHKLQIFQQIQCGEHSSSYGPITEVSSTQNTEGFFNSFSCQICKSNILFSLETPYFCVIFKKFTGVVWFQENMN